MTNHKKMNTILVSLLAVFAILIVAIVITQEITKNNEDNTASSSESVIEDNEQDKDTDKKDDDSKDINLAVNINIPVLYYHSVNPSEENELIISPDRIKEQLKYVKESGYTTITMKEYIDYLKDNKQLPEKSILLTFDDGYMDNYTYLFPILKELNMKATIFVITSGIGDGYYLSKDQILEMYKYGIDFGSHTVHHSYLAEISEEQMVNEITQSRKILKNLLKTDITTIAYPFGNYNEKCVEVTKQAGYTLGFTTNYGTTNKSSNLYELKRVYVSSKYSFDEFKTRLNNSAK